MEEEMLSLREEIEDKLEASEEFSEPSCAIFKIRGGS